MTDWTMQDIRRRAVDLLAQRGWTPGGYGEQRPISADWAIALASGEAHGPWPAADGPYLTTTRELEALLGRGSLLDWEYQERRTAEQVIELLRSGYVAGGGQAPLTPEEQVQARLAGERLTAALARQKDALKQMRERTGPIYELARERSRIIGEAYRAAGSPRHVAMVRGPDGWHIMRIVGRGAHTRYEPSTETEWRAWRTWASDRDL